MAYTDLVLHEHHVTEEMQAQEVENLEKMCKFLLNSIGKDVRIKIGRWHHWEILEVNYGEKRFRYSCTGMPNSWCDMKYVEEYLAVTLN